MASTIIAETLPQRDFPVLNARLNLPEELTWFNALNAGERLDFFSGLLVILSADGASLLAALDEYLRGWRWVTKAAFPELELDEEVTSYQAAVDAVLSTKAMVKINDSELARKVVESPDLSLLNLGVLLNASG